MTSKVAFTYQGSKLSEIKYLRPFIPEQSRMVEPFFGTGTVTNFFGAHGSIGNDYNREITEIFTCAKDNDGLFFDLCLEYMSENNRDQDYYYKLRDEYNQMWKNDIWNSKRSALFYYLLNSCHAGLVRYGKNGFNVGFKLFLLNGRKYHASDKLSNLKNISKKLKQIDNLKAIDFLKKHESNFNDYDIIYCDPPYVKSINIYIDSWSIDDLLELDDYLDYATKKYNILALMSNYPIDEPIKGKIISEFDKTRMASTKLTKSKNVIVGYGYDKVRKLTISDFLSE